MNTDKTSLENETQPSCLGAVMCPFSSQIKIKMEKLIEALQIFLKYKNETYPTHCEHDILMVVGITEEEVSQEDKYKLGELGFRWSSEYDCWSSFRYGSA